MSKSFKGSMANYYHEARAQVKKIKTMQEENKKRAERRAELTAPAAPDPLQQLSVMGTACKLLRGAESHAMNEAGDNLVPWNGQLDTMIDRFDVRSLLDYYKEPDARVLAARQKSSEELKLEETLQFERYRDLVRIMARGLSEEQGLTAVEQESLNARAAQHAALQAANDAVYCNDSKQQQQQQQLQLRGVAGTGTAAGTGVYSAIGFTYDTSGAPLAAGAGAAAAAAAAVASDSSDSDSDSDDDGDGGAAAGPESEADLAQEAEDERIDEMAEGFGLQDFCYRLHRALEKEGEQEALLRKRPKKRFSRKKAANRARRMAGMGLNPATGLPWREHDPYADPRSLVNPWQQESGRDKQRAASPDRPLQRRSSPSYDAGGWRSRDRSDSPRPGQRQYITEFVAADGAAAKPGASGYLGSSNLGGGGGRIIDALPDRPDPAMLGGIQPVARDAFTVQGIKREDLHKQLKQESDDELAPYQARSSSRDRARARDRSRSRERHRSSRRTARSRSSSRDRGRSRSRSADRYRSTRDRRYPSRSRSRSRDRLRTSRRRSRSRSRSRSPRNERRSDTGSKYGSGSGGSRGAAAATPAAAAAARGAGGSTTKSGSAVGGRASAASAAAKGPGSSTPKETPQERLKRLMQAQLNKAAQKDSLAVAQKKIQLLFCQQWQQVLLAAASKVHAFLTPGPVPAVPAAAATCLPHHVCLLTTRTHRLCCIVALGHQFHKAEKDKVARAQIERVALAAGRNRDRDRAYDRSPERSPSPRSLSPPGRYGRSRRSRSR